MNKPTDPPPPAETAAAAIAGAGRVSPVQQAHRAYITHTRACDRCRDIDRQRCADGQGLWRAWDRACADAYRRLADETP